MNVPDDMPPPQNEVPPTDPRHAKPAAEPAVQPAADPHSHHAPGSHPVGTGLGAVGGAAAGAAIGSVGGPIGTAIGGVIGAIAGGAAGHGIATSIDPNEEDAYWRENYRNEPFHTEGYDYADYEPAFRLGYLNYPTQAQWPHPGAEDQLAKDWETNRGSSRLEWHHALPAARAAWHRVQARHLKESRAAKRDDELGAADDCLHPEDEFSSFRSDESRHPSDEPPGR